MPDSKEDALRKQYLTYLNLNAATGAMLSNDDLERKCYAFSLGITDNQAAKSSVIDLVKRGGTLGPPVPVIPNSSGFDVWSFIGSGVGKRAPKATGTDRWTFNGNGVGDAPGIAAPVTWDVAHTNTFDSALTAPFQVTATSVWAQTSGVLYNSDDVDVAWVNVTDGRRQRVTINGHPFASDMSRGAIFGVYIKGANSSQHRTGPGHISSLIGWEIAKTNTESKVVLYKRVAGVDTELDVYTGTINISQAYQLRLVEEISDNGLDVVGYLDGVERARHTLTVNEELQFLSNVEVGIVNFRGFSNYYDFTAETETPVPAPVEKTGFRGDENSLFVVNSTATAQAIIPNSYWDNTSYAGVNCWIINDANPVISGVKVMGGIELTSMVTFTIKNSVVEFNNDFHWNTRLAWGGPFNTFNVIDTTVRFKAGDGPVLGSGMIGGIGGPSAGAYVARSDLSGGSDILTINGPNYRVVDNYIHDVYVGPLSGQANEMSHSNAFHCYHNSGLILRRNRVMGPDTATNGTAGSDADIFMPIDPADIATVDCIIEDNYLFGGHFNLVLEPNARKNRIRRNVFAGGAAFGVAQIKTGAEVLEWTGNVNASGTTVNQPAFSGA